MFARHMMLQLKPNLVNELPVTFEKEILPLLRRQKGFVDDVVLPANLDSQGLIF
jgi:hypothetical protein